MISEIEATQLIQRLVGLRGFPSRKEGQLELIKALAHAPTIEIANRIVDDWIATRTDAPRPADIRTLTADESDRLRQSRMLEAPRYTCSRCQDTGLYGGHLPPSQYAGPWKWCDCSASIDRQQKENVAIAAGRWRNTVNGAPSNIDSVAEGNEAREKIIARFRLNEPQPKQGLRHVSSLVFHEPYHGQF